MLAGMYAGTRFEPLIAEGFDLRKTVAEQAETMAQARRSDVGRDAGRQPQRDHRAAASSSRRGAWPA